MAKKLGIAVWHNLPSGGARRALSSQIEGLVKRGHSIEVWSAPLKDPEHHGLPAGVVQHVLPLDDRHSPDTNRPPASRTLLGRVRDFANYHRVWLDTHDRFSQQCATEINRQQFDVLFAHNCWRMHSPFIGRHVRVHKALYLHEPKRMLYEAVTGSPWLPYKLKAQATHEKPTKRGAIKDFFDFYGKRLEIAAELENAKSFDKILVNSLYSRESVLRAYGLESSVCRLGIDTDLFHPTTVKKQPYVVSVGHVGKPKNTHFLIEAIGRMPAPRPALVLVTHWIDQQYRVECDELAAKLDVDVRYREGVSDEELVQILSEASVFAYAPKLEPFGLAPLEANACGTAAVAVAEAGPRESIRTGENGFLVDNEADEMAECLEKFVAHPDFAIEMGVRARNYVQQNWNMEQATDELEKRLVQVAELN